MMDVQTELTCKKGNLSIVPIKKIAAFISFASRNAPVLVVATSMFLCFLLRFSCAADRRETWTITTVPKHERERLGKLEVCVLFIQLYNNFYTTILGLVC